MKEHNTVKMIWHKLHLPPKKIVAYTSIQAAIDDASKWRPTMVLVKKGEYSETITCQNYVDIEEARVAKEAH